MTDIRVPPCFVSCRLRCTALGSEASNRRRSGLATYRIRRLKVKITRRTSFLAITLLLAVYAGAQNVVVQWDAISSTTIIANAKEASVASGVWLAYVHLAVFDAVNAIDHRFQPYLFTTNPPAGANQDAGYWPQ